MSTAHLITIPSTRAFSKSLCPEDWICNPWEIPAAKCTYLVIQPFVISLAQLFDMFSIPRLFASFFHYIVETS